MGRTLYRGLKILVSIFLLASAGLGQSSTSDSSPSQQGLGEQERIELANKLDELLQQNQKLEDQAQRVEEQNRKLRDEIREIREKLAGQPTTAQKPAQPSGKKEIPVSINKSVQSIPVAKPTQTDEESEESKEATTVSTVQEEKPDENKKWGTYTPNLGYKLANTEFGDVSLSIYTYTRYLNQRLLDATYTNSFGTATSVQQRQDFQIQKLQIKFLGWVFSQNLRYFLYAWTSNPTQGQGAQVVLAGNLGYKFNKHLTFSAGITSLPGTRSVEGNFPFWLGVDTRLIADEFFRPSYTSGIWAKGAITDKLRYQAMLGNNLSTLGVSASQLDNRFNTFSSALIWEPAGEFGQGFGDFENHEKPAMRVAGHFTRSHETAEEQPNTQTFENTQIRLADGSIIFTPNLFGSGSTVNTVNTRMVDFDSGLKYRGFSLDGEFFMRWLNNFTGTNVAGLPSLFDKGFQMQASAMMIPKTLQFYAGGSTVFGKFGNPYDTRVGLNWFPWKNKVVRVNNEFLYLYRSPVGYSSVPFVVGGTGLVFHSNLELAF
jgi:regulator of replication initiation timing